MTPKQQRFVEEYLIDLNATQAAIRAGYSVRTAKVQGCQNLTKLNIQQAIQVAQEKRAARTEVTADYVIKGLKAEAELVGEGSSQAGRTRALELLGKHLGIFSDKLEVTGRDGNPFQVVVYIPENNRDGGNKAATGTAGKLSGQ